MTPTSYGTAPHGALEHITRNRTPFDVWFYRVENLWEMTQSIPLTAEQREYLRHYHDEHLRVGPAPLITHAVKILTNVPETN